MHFTESLKDELQKFNLYVVKFFPNECVFDF